MYERWAVMQQSAPSSLLLKLSSGKQCFQLHQQPFMPTLLQMGHGSN